MWQRALDGEQPWEEVFDGFQSTVDWPGSFFYKELAEFYPDAKVLLSVRDADAWERSMRDTIWGIFYGDILIRDLSTARTRVDPQWNGYIELMKVMWQQSGLLNGDAKPTLPEGDANKVAVIAQAPLEKDSGMGSATLTFAFRNNTGEAISHVELRNLLNQTSAEARYGAFHALRSLDERDEAIKGEQLNGSFWLHHVAPQATGLVHYTMHRRPEVVLFGPDAFLRPPFQVSAGNGLP